MLKIGKKKPQQTRSESTVDAIFEAVTRILNKDGLIALNTNKIAEVAGVSVGSLYQYFKNKESILEALLVKLTEQNLANLEKVISEVNPEEMSMREFITIIVETQFGTYEKLGKLSHILFQYAPQLLPISHFKKSDERIVSFLMKKMVEYKLPLRVENPEVAFYLCAQTMRASIFMTFNNKSPEDFPAIKKELIDMLTTYLELKE